MDIAAVPKKIGLIGLGLMGHPMGMNLLKAGFDLTLWNRTASKARDLVEAGAHLATSPAAVASSCDLLITIVSDPPALEEVLWGRGEKNSGEKNGSEKNSGALAALRPGSTYIDSSTVSPELARKIAATCAERRVHFLDAPVTGGNWGAQKGELIFMVGGDAKVLKAAEPVLQVMGKKWFHLGPNGAGQTIKLAMNLLLALQVGALAESIALVRAAGLRGEQLVEVMQSSMGRSPLLDVKAPMLLSGDFKPSFPLRLMYKDLGLALDLAKQVGVNLPATIAEHKIYSAVQGAAREDLDYASIMSFWNK